MIVKDNKFYDFWVPQYRYQLLSWLKKHKTKDKHGNPINWKTYPTKQLLAIYINERIKIEDNKENKQHTSTPRKSGQLELFPEIKTFH